MKYKKEFIGETFGTFILVLFGCGSVASSVLFDAFSGLFQIAIIWGIGVTLAIYLTRHISCAHLNPAVSLSMAVSKRMKWQKLPVYLLAQFIGAFLAALVLYALLAPSIENYEQLNAITRGTPESMQTAKMFGEYYAQPGNIASVTMPLAMLAEAFGTFILVLLIFSLTENCNVGKPHDNIAPLFIGLTVTAIICLIAPLTQAGINPARDFGPRLVAILFGWGEAAFPDDQGGFFFVYIVSPLIGGLLATVFFTHILEPAMNMANKKCCEQ